MGIYYKVINETKKQVLDPDSLGWNNKWEVLFDFDFLRILMLLMHGEWHGDKVCILSDAGDEQDRFYIETKDWEDISERAKKHFDETFGSSH